MIDGTVLREVGCSRIRERGTDERETDPSLARAASERRGCGGVGADDRAAEATSEAGAASPDPAWIGDRRLFAASAGGHARREPSRGPCGALEVAAQTLADVAGVALASASMYHSQSGHRGRSSEGGEGPLVQVSSFRRGVFLPNTVPAKLRVTPPGRCTSPDSIHSKGARNHRESRSHPPRLVEGCHKSERLAWQAADDGLDGLRITLGASLKHENELRPRCA